MPHNDELHRQAAERGDYADEILFDEEQVLASLIHFADGSHGVRLDLMDRGLSMVIDTPAWTDLDAVLFEVSAAEPTLGSGYVTVETANEDGEARYRVTIQGGDVVGRVRIVMFDDEVELLKRAILACRDAVE